MNEGAIGISELIINNKEQIVTTKLEIVYNVLRENILSGNLEPGTRLIITKIAQELGVSEIPVREAIRSLEAQGLVTMTPHTGAQVAKFDAKDVEEAMEVRSILEGYAARTAMPYITKDIINQLKECTNQMKQRANEGDFGEFGILNRRFHQIICELTPNKRLYKMIINMLNEFERTRAVFGLSKKRSQDSINEHEAILEAIAEKNADKVEFLIREHRQRVGNVLVNVINESKQDRRSKKEPSR